MPNQHDFEVHPDRGLAHLRALGIRRGLDAGMHYCAAEEFADCFVVHMNDASNWKKWRDAQFASAWAVRCAVNFLLDFLSKTSTVESHEASAEMCRAKLESVAVESARPVEDALNAETSGELQSALIQLTAGQQEAVRLRFFEDLSFAEIAQMLAVSPEAARMLVSRSLPKLAKTLAAMNFDVDAALAAIRPPPMK